MFKEHTARLVKSGCEVKVVTSNSGGLEGRASYDGVEVHYFRWPTLFGHPIPKRRDLHEFVEWADVVHTATYTAAPVALSVSKKFDRPCIATVYEALGAKWFWIEKNILKSLAFFLFEQFVLKKRYSLFHAISIATQNDLIAKGIDARDIRTIYPGISGRFVELSNRTNSAAQFRPVPDEDAKVFLYFGRPGKTKGIFILLDAITRLRNRLPEGLKFVFILGKEPIGEYKKLKRAVEKNNFRNIVKIMDPLTDEALVQQLRKAYCVVIPSITEGFGYTAAESCSLGKPVIASDAGSLPEVVSGKVLFFQNRNSADLSEKILLACEGRFMNIAKKDFDWDAPTVSLLDVYQALIERKELSRKATTAVASRF